MPPPPPPRSRLVRIFRVRLRRAMLRVDRGLPDWLHWVTPLGTSLTLHGLLLIVMGVTIYASVQAGPRGAIRADFAQQLSEDVTSLASADRSGDPFTTLDSLEPPSLPLTSDLEDSTEIRVPELPPNFRLGPELQRIAPREPGNLPPSGPGMGSFSASTLPLMAPFSGRQGPGKARLIRREGGTVESEKAVEQGLDWLARHQRRDGGWSLDPKTQCQGGGCPVVPAMDSDTAATGLGLLPLLGAGHIHTEPGRFQDQVSRGLGWLMRHQKGDGDLFVGGSGTTHMYSHAIATMALCEAYGLSHDPKLREPALRAMTFIIRAQDPRSGGWRYEPGQPGDTSVFGWQMFALRSAALADLPVPKAAVRGCLFYLSQATADPYRATYSYMPGRKPDAVMTAEALLARQYLGWARQNLALIKGARLVAEDLDQSQERNIYYWYYATQLLHNLQGPTWERWNARVREELIAEQVTGTGCDCGSWNPQAPQPDRWGRQAGRHFQTALSLLTLEVYYRYLPLYESPEGKGVASSTDSKAGASKARAGDQ